MNRCGSNRDLLLRVGKILQDAPSWCIFSHQKLDGDAVGSASALFEAGVAMSKRVKWMGPDPVPYTYMFLPNVNEYVCTKEYAFDDKRELYVFLDSANDERGVRGLQDRDPDVVVLNIDHHEDNNLFGSINCIDPESSSAAELLWNLMTLCGWNVTTRIAECLYTGIVADTGGFMFSNTTPRTHFVAADLLEKGVDSARIYTYINQTRSLPGMHLWSIAWGRIVCWGEEKQIAMSWLKREDFERTDSVMADTESLIGQLLTIRGVRFAVLLVEEENSVKGSFRSKEGAPTAASVARLLGGGGHPRASGATLPLPLDRTLQTVRKAVDDAYDGWIAADR